jgi:CheY-like chemotaxis protein
MTEAKKPLILLADDDNDIRGILALKLRAAGLEVVEATNGQDAIDKAHQRPPDLIVMDVRMPVMSGTEAMGVIKSDPQTKDIKVVFLSNFGEEDEINAWIDQKFAREMGAVDYMKKSDDLQKIIAKIQEMLTH